MAAVVVGVAFVKEVKRELAQRNGKVKYVRRDWVFGVHFKNEKAYFISCVVSSGSSRRRLPEGGPGQVYPRVEAEKPRVIYLRKSFGPVKKALNVPDIASEVLCSRDTLPVVSADATA